MSGWVEVRVCGVPAERVDAVSGTLWDEGASGVEELEPPDLARPPRQPWDEGPPPPPLPRLDLRAWFEDETPRTLEERLGRELPGLTVKAEPLPEVDWEQRAEASFPRMELAPGLAVAAPWNAVPGDVVVDPGVGFGTGHHPTTRALLDALAAAGPTLAGRRVLDVGCGSGILALVAARLGAEVTATDVDPEAVEATRRNATLSGLRVDASTRSLAEVDGPYDLVLANLHAEVLVQLADALADVTGDALWVAGVMEEKEGPVAARLGARLAPTTRWHAPPWVALGFARRT